MTKHDAGRLILSKISAVCGEFHTEKDYQFSGDYFCDECLKEFAEILDALGIPKDGFGVIQKCVWGKHGYDYIVCSWDQFK